MSLLMHNWATFCVLLEILVILFYTKSKPCKFIFLEGIPWQPSGLLVKSVLYVYIYTTTATLKKIYIQQVSIFTGQFEIDFHRWLCTCPKIEPTHEWAREFQENTKITWDLITRASFRIPSYMIAIAQLAAMKFARKFALFWNAFF